MLAVIGLVYSFGVVLAQRRAQQGAADAASLAGTWQVLSELASDNRSDANVLGAVQTYALANAVAAANLSAIYVDSGGNQDGTVGAGGQFATTVRGVRVTVSGNVPAILPGLVQVVQVLVQGSATAAALPTVSPISAPVIPIAVSASSFSVGATYDLFKNPPPGSGVDWATLDLSSAGAPTFGATSVNAQYWSDGEHLGNWQLKQPASVNLADTADYDSVAAGLLDNVRRQGSGYAVLMVPIYDTTNSNPPSVHVVGFAEVKLTGSAITATSAPGLFVPYPAGAYGTPQTPSPDVGATFVTLTL